MSDDGKEQTNDLTENDDVTPLDEMRERTDREAPPCPNCKSEDTVYVGGFTVDSICYACDTTFLADHVELKQNVNELGRTIRRDFREMSRVELFLRLAIATILSSGVLWIAYTLSGG